MDEAGDIVMTGTTMRALGLASSATAKLKRARVADGDWDHAAPMYLVPQEILRNIMSSLTALQAQYDQMMSLGGQPSPGTGSSISEEAMPQPARGSSAASPSRGAPQPAEFTVASFNCGFQQTMMTGKLSAVPGSGHDSVQ